MLDFNNLIMGTTYYNYYDYHDIMTLLACLSFVFIFHPIIGMRLGII